MNKLLNWIDEFIFYTIKRNPREADNCCDSCQFNTECICCSGCLNLQPTFSVLEKFSDD